MEAIRSVLVQLVVGEESHWTAEGLPRVDVISQLVGAAVTREQITDAAPLFTRQNPSLDQPQAVEPEPTAPAPQPAAPPRSTDEEQKAAHDGRNRWEAIAAEIGELQQQKGEIEGRITVLVREQARLQRFAPSDSYDPKADQERRMAYIQSQHEMRAARAARISGMVEAAAAGAKQAPIDAAMARKQARPNYPTQESPQA